jgi:cytochrome c oxidase subunit 2
MTLPLLPWVAPASSAAAGVDRLFFALLGVAGAVVLGIFATMTVFCIRYRRGSRAERGGRPENARALEIAWIAVPLALFLGVFAWSAALFAGMHRPPAQALPVYVLAKQWMWEAQYPGGQREINALHVPVGVPVRLLLMSQDVIHSFYAPAFRVKQDVVPGMITQLWFRADRAGTFQLLCAEFCGAEHATMGGKVVALAPADYAAWQRAHAAAPLAARGAALFRQYGCSGCHAPGSRVHAPDLSGLYGRPVPLADGRMARADEAYLYDSIMLPSRDVAAGYPDLMPSFRGRIDDRDALALVAYLRQLGPSPETAR